MVQYINQNKCLLNDDLSIAIWEQLFRLSHATWTTVEVYVGVFVLAINPVITGYYYEATSDGGHILEEGAS